MAKMSWDQLDADELERVRSRLLRKQVRYQLYAYSEHYRSVFEQAGVDVEGFAGLRDLARIPLLMRDELGADPDAFLLRPTESLIQRWGRGGQLTQVFVDKLLRGSEHSSKELDHEYSPVHVLRTHGRASSSIPIGITRWDVGTMSTLGMRALQVAGVDRHANVFNGLANFNFAFWCFFLGGVALGVRQEAPGHLEPREAAKLAQASGANVLIVDAEEALLVLETLPRDPQTVILGPSHVSEDLKQQIKEAAGGATVISTYGFTEARAVYAECVEGAGRSDCGFHAYPDFEIFEVVGHSSANLLGQRRAGRIVYTPLNQRGTAVARYVPGDVALGGLASNRCPYCGRMVDRILGPVARGENLIEIQTPGSPVRMVDVEHISSALHASGLTQWELEVSKWDGDPRGPDEVFLFFRPSRGKDPAELAAWIDATLKTKVGIEVSQIVLADRELSGVVDSRRVSDHS